MATNEKDDEDARERQARPLPMIPSNNENNDENMIPNTNENNGENNGENYDPEENEWLEDYDYVALNCDVIEDQEADVSSSKTSAHR